MKFIRTNLVSCLFIVITIMLFVFNSDAAYLENVPQTVRQPDGTVLNLLASGDEFFNRLHDAEGYTIIQSPETGYYVYALEQNGDLVASDYIVGRSNPAAIELKKGAMISPEKIYQKREEYHKIGKSKQNKDAIQNDLTEGEINNIVIFIRFADDPEFDLTYYDVNEMFNSEDGNSLHNYYYNMSYGTLDIQTHFYPKGSGQIVASYQDTNPRAYYQAYNRITNPIGYRRWEYSSREQEMLARAVEHVENDIPYSLDLDADNNDMVDNVCFVIYGMMEAWSDLLWPHKWHFFYTRPEIRGIPVYSYNFQLSEGGYFNTAVLSHEMFHTLGAPDLYHYSHDGFDPAGVWALMGRSPNPPSSIGAHMKYKYGEWIDKLPEIDEAGEYTLNEIGSEQNNCYMIKSPVSVDEYFILEYRRKHEELFDSEIPGSGLLVYRINPTYSGNRNGPPDEVYIYRPDETLTIPVAPDSAFFSSQSGRTEINGSTNPFPFLSDGSNGFLNIYDIGEAGGEKISFKVSFDFPKEALTLINPENKEEGVGITPDINFQWSKSPNAIKYHLQVARDSDFIDMVFDNNNVFSNSTKLAGSLFEHNREYYWKVSAEGSEGTLPWSETWSFETEPERSGIFVWDGARNKYDYDTEFIASFLEAKGLQVRVSEKLPTSFEGYDAVFLSFGSLILGNPAPVIVTPVDSLIGNYLLSGGNLYLEGGYALGPEYYHSYQRDYLLPLLGIISSENVYMDISNDDIFKGSGNSICSDMNFNGTKQINLIYMDHYGTNVHGEIALTNEQNLVIAVQSSGHYGQKTFVMSPALSSLNDGDLPSTRHEFLSRLLDFFELKSNDEYIIPGFSAGKTTGNAPLEIKFSDMSASRGTEPASWAWDFDNDGTDDAFGANPEWVYSKDGDYSVRMTISDGSNDYTRVFEDTIHVFRGECAAAFDPAYNYAISTEINSSLHLSGAFTIEEWIYPVGLGALDPYRGNYQSGSLAFYREAVHVHFPDQRQVRVSIVNEDGSAGMTETPRRSIKLNEWQHIAITYDGNGDIRMYLDGIEQYLRPYQGFDFKSGLYDSGDYNEFVIGNSCFHKEGINNSFHGRIDEVRLWNIARTGDEIRAAMMDTLKGDENGLIGYWRFNEGNGAMSEDFSGNDNTAEVNALWEEGWYPDSGVSVSNGKEQGDRANLSHVSPNPVSKTAVISYEVDQAADVELKLYNQLGTLILKPVNSGHDIGNFDVQIDMSNLPDGIYYYTIIIGGHTETGKIILLK